MLQRGRKGKLQREMMSLASLGSPQATVQHFAAPPADLAEGQRTAWRDIVARHDLGVAGSVMLKLALQSLGRADQCAKLIEQDGGPLLVGKYGRQRRHPLLTAEIASRKLARDIFKLLRIAA